MKKFISTHLPTAVSLADIAHEILVETRNAAVTKASDLRAQVEELWESAGEMLPRAKSRDLMRKVESAIETLRNRDTIGFPTSVKR